MKIQANQAPERNQFFAGIEFHKVYEFWFVSRKLVPAKICSTLPIIEIWEA